jgi:hypothetical protein
VEGQQYMASLLRICTMRLLCQRQQGKRRIGMEEIFLDKEADAQPHLIKHGGDLKR